MPFRIVSADRANARPRARSRPPSSLTAPEPLSPSPSPSPPAAARSAKRARHKVDRTGPNWDAEGDYIVGKGRPPKATRWQKGQSGNPKGPRKREPLTAQARLEQAFLAPFKMIANGEEIEFTMDQFAVQALKKAAAKGSVKAAQYLLELYTALVRKSAEAEPGPQVNAWEQSVIDSLLQEFDLPARPVVRAIDRSQSDS